MPAKSPLASSLRRKRPLLADLLSELAMVEGFGPTCLPDVRLMRSTETHPSSPVSYDPSIVIIAQGRKRGRLGTITTQWTGHAEMAMSGCLHSVVSF